MARTVTASGLTIGMKMVLREAEAGVPNPGTITRTLDFADYDFQIGTGSGKVNLGPFIASETLTASSSTTYDLTSYLDSAEDSVTTLTKLKLLVIKNTGTVSIDIGGAAATQLIGAGFLKAATDIFTLQAGETLLVRSIAGITVSGTIKSLKVLNTSGSVSATYDIYWVGSSS